MLDVSDAGQVVEVARKFLDTQILINNAGTLHPGNILSADLEGFKKDMEINYFAVIAMMRAFAPELERNKDFRIVDIASIASYVNFPFIAGYSASKAASIELSAKNNPVDIVNPGAIDTDMNKGSTMQMTSPEDVDERVHELFCDKTHDDGACLHH